MVRTEGMDDLPFESDEGPSSEQRIAKIKLALPRLSVKYPWIPSFLLALGASGMVESACKIAGIDRHTAYAVKNAHPTFARAWADADEDAVDDLLAAARVRALNGSDRLLMFLLKALRPEIYGRKLGVANAPAAAIRITFNRKMRDMTSADEMTDAELEGIINGDVEIAGDAPTLYGDDEHDMADDEDAA